MRKLLAGIAAAAFIAAAVPIKQADPWSIQKGMIFMFIGGSPALTPGFRAAYTNTANQNSYTFAASDLGPAHASRMVVVCAVTVSSSVSALTVDGTAAVVVGTEISGGPALRGTMWRAASTANPTGDIVVTCSGAVNCTIGVYCLYPSSHTPVDTVSAQDNGTAYIALNVAKTSGGFTVMMAATRDNSSTITFTQTGAETITEDYDAVTETSCRAFASHVNTATTSVDDYTATTGVNDEGGVIVSTWF